MSAKNILIVDDIHPIFIERAEALGYHCDYQPTIRPDEAYAIVGNYEGLGYPFQIFGYIKWRLTWLPDCALYAVPVREWDNIDEAYANEKGITLINAPEGNMDAVGEHAVGMLLSLMNNFNRADAEVLERRMGSA